MGSLALFVAPGMPCTAAGEELLLNPADRPITSGWTFGRSTDCDFVFDHSDARTVSRHHCALQYSPLAGRWHLIDLDSTCGTWLNGFRLPPRDPTPLTIRDRFSLGTLTADFVVLEGPNDTIDDDDGPATIASTDPVTMPPQMVSAPQQSRTYGDSLYAFVSWVTSAETTLGGLYRLGVVALTVALFVVLISVFL